MSNRWIRTSYDIPPIMRSAIRGYIASKNVTMQSVVLSLYLALLNGDISIKENISGVTRKGFYPDFDFESEIVLDLYNREGELINPTRGGGYFD